jgi:hypothetical protein
MVRVLPAEWFLLFLWEALLVSSTERRFTLDATRAGPYSHDSYQGILDIRVWEGLVPAASGISDPSSAAVILHIKTRLSIPFISVKFGWALASLLY